MQKHGLIFQTLGLIVFVFIFSLIAQAQATRTWVSGDGDDANPCTRKEPCKTFAGSISKTTTGGEINCLDPGGFGSVTITKSITIDCKGTTGGIMATLMQGLIINGPTAVVRIRGLAINGGGTGLNGIKIVAAAKVYVDDTVIDGFTLQGISVENSGEIKVVINNSTIRNNTAAGINSLPSGTAEIAVTNSILSGNSTGLNAGPGATFRISGNTITANSMGLAAASRGKIISFQNNAIDGNGTNGAPTATISLQ